MTDLKKKNPSIRPGWRIFDWLNDEQSARRKATGRKLTYEELLEEKVFGTAHSPPPRGGPDTHIGSVPEQPKDSETLPAVVRHIQKPVESQPEISDEEGPWVERFLRVIRSRKPGLADALRANVTQFVDAAAYWERTNGGDAEIPGQGAGAGKREGPGEDDQRSPGTKRTMREDESKLEDLQRRIEERRSGKKRPPGKAGAGG